MQWKPTAERAFWKQSRFFCVKSTKFCEFLLNKPPVNKVCFLEGLPGEQGESIDNGREQDRVSAAANHPGRKPDFYDVVILTVQKHLWISAAGSSRQSIPASKSWSLSDENASITTFCWLFCKIKHLMHHNCIKETLIQTGTDRITLSTSSPSVMKVGSWSDSVGIETNCKFAWWSLGIVQVSFGGRDLISYYLIWFLSYFILPWRQLVYQGAGSYWGTPRAVVSLIANVISLFLVYHVNTFGWKMLSEILSLFQVFLKGRVKARPSHALVIKWDSVIWNEALAAWEGAPL